MIYIFYTMFTLHKSRVGSCRSILAVRASCQIPPLQPLTLDNPGFQGRGPNRQDRSQGVARPRSTSLSILVLFGGKVNLEKWSLLIGW